MKEVHVNENCIGCGMCAAIDPEHFTMNGVSTPISNENLDSDALKNALESCPVSAIDVIEVQASEQTEEQVPEPTEEETEN